MKATLENIGKKVWAMRNNKPVEVIVIAFSKFYVHVIMCDHAIMQGNEDPLGYTYRVELKELYDTKELLINSLFKT